MVRIGAPGDISFRGKLVDDPLHALAVAAPCPGEPGHRLRAFGANAIAPKTCQRALVSPRRDEPIAGGEQATVETEHLENEVGYVFGRIRLPDRRVSLTLCSDIDSILSI